MEIFKYLSTPSIIILIGTIITAIGVIMSSMDDTKVQSELKEKTEKIAELNETISQTITGGEIYPYVLVSFDVGTRGLVEFMLISKGEFPLYDVTVSILDHTLATDIMKIKGEEKITRKDTELWNKQLKIGNFGPNQGKDLSQFMFPQNKDEMEWTFNILARNGQIYQKVKIIRDTLDHKREENYFKLESKVMRGQKVLEEVK